MTPLETRLETLLQQLTSPTPHNTSQTSKHLTTLLSTPQIESLSNILLNHPSAPIRQLSATLLRTHQLTNFSSLPQQTLQTLVSTYTTHLFQEPHPPTRRAIIEILKSLPNISLQTTSHALQTSSNPSLRALALTLPQTLQSLHQAFQDPSPEVRIAALPAFATLTTTPEEAHVQLVQQLLPKLSNHVTQKVYLYEALSNLLPHPSFHRAFLQTLQHALTDLANAAPAAAPAVEYLLYAIERRPRAVKAAGFVKCLVDTCCALIVTAVDDSVFLSMRLLDGIATQPILSDQVFDNCSNALVRIQTPDPTFRIITAIADGCARRLTTHAETLFQTLFTGYAVMNVIAMDALAALTGALDVEEISDTVVNTIAQTALNLVIAALKHPDKHVRNTSCVALHSVLPLFRNHTLGGRVGEIVQSLVTADAGVVEAVLAVGVLAENASESLVADPGFRVLLSRTVGMMVSSCDDGMTAAAYEAAGSLISVCEDVSLINTLSEHAVQGLDSDDPAVKQGALSFFATLADTIPSTAFTVYAERVLEAAIESVEQKDMFITTDDHGNIREIDLADLHDSGTLQVRTAYLDEKMVAVACIGAYGTAVATDDTLNSLSAAPDSAKRVLAMLNRSTDLINVMTVHFHSDIRASAYRACCRLAAGNVYVHARAKHLAFSPIEFTNSVMTIVLEGLTHDDDQWVVTDLLNAFSIFLTEIPPDTIVTRKDDIVTTLTLLITGKASCQVREQDEDHDEDEAGNEEMDSLIEAIGDVVEALARALRGHFASHFAMLLDTMLKHLYGASQSGRRRGMVLGTLAGVLLFMCWERCPFPPPPDNDGSYHVARSVCDDLASVAVRLAVDGIGSGASRTLQRNAVFLLGVLYERCTGGNNVVWVQLPAVLEGLQQILNTGKIGNGALVDNAAGALARIVSVDVPSHIPFNKFGLLQTCLNCVPLEDDPTENTTIARAIVKFGDRAFEECVKRDLGRVVSCLATALLVHVETSRKKCRWVCTVDPNDEMVRLDDCELKTVVGLLKSVKQFAPDVFGRLGLAERDANVLASVMG